MRISLNNAVDAAIGSIFLERLNQIESTNVPNILTRHEQITTVEKLNGTDTVSLPWLGHVPKARPFAGERQFAQVDAGKFALTLTKYEASITLPRGAFNSYIGDGVRAKIRSLADELVRYKVRQSVSVLANGTNVAAYDGEPLLSPSRGNLTGNALSLQSVQEGIAAMGSFQNEYGVSLQKRPTHLLVGPKLEMTARQILNSSTIVIAGTTNTQLGSANPIAGTLELLVSYDLIGAYDDYWFLLDLSGIRPVVAGVHNDFPDELIIHSDPNTSSSVFLRDEILAGITSFFGATAGDPYAVYAGIL